jgi:hypothetical protein
VVARGFHVRLSADGVLHCRSSKDEWSDFLRDHELVVGVGAVPAKGVDIFEFADDNEIVVSIDKTHIEPYRIGLDLWHDVGQPTKAVHDRLNLVLGDRRRELHHDDVT